MDVLTNIEKTIELVSQDYKVALSKDRVMERYWLGYCLESLDNAKKHYENFLKA